MRSRTLGGLLTAATLALLVSCTSTPAAAPAPTMAVDATHAAADVMFAQGMIPHHQQAIAMARLVDTRAASAQVKELATRIEDAQDPEIDQLTAMLTAWGVTTSSAAPDAHAGHGGGGASAAPMPGMTGMPGMMSEQETADLVATSGPAFDRAFLTMMISHHTGAVQMAQTELAQGTNPQARALAQSIITAQQAEIAQMQGLLAA